VSDALPLLWSDDLDTPLAWRAGQALSRRQYLADVAALAARLPETGAMLNLTGDRYLFAVGLGAAMLRGQRSLLPPNHTPDMVERLSSMFPGTYALTDHPDIAPALHVVRHADAPAASDSVQQVPQIDESAIAVQVLTSGSTGAPVPHPKAWGYLQRGVQAEARRLAQQMGLPTFAGVTIVATVPAQHMYGFESTVLLSLLVT
jgi:hypothetical protein